MDFSIFKEPFFFSAIWKAPIIHRLCWRRSLIPKIRPYLHPFFWTYINALPLFIDLSRSSSNPMAYPEEIPCLQYLLGSFDLFIDFLFFLEGAFLAVGYRREALRSTYSCSCEDCSSPPCSLICMRLSSLMREWTPSSLTFHLAVTRKWDILRPIGKKSFELSSSQLIYRKSNFFAPLIYYSFSFTLT